MFTSFATLAREVRGHFIDMYWMLIIPLSLIVFLLEFFKEENPAPGKILRRIFISVILLLSFDFCSGTIISITGSIAKKIDGISKLGVLADILGDSIQKIDLDWFSIRKSLIYLIGLLSYLIAYVGVFAVQAVIQFSWTLLYICSPFMILAFISPKSAGVTGSLYRGMINISLWNIMASILGVLLLEFAKSADYNQENFLTVIIVNLCIAFSLLLIPFTVKSLMGDGFSSAASGMAAAPGLVVAGEFKRRTMGLAKAMEVKTGRQIKRGVSRMAQKTGRFSRDLKEKGIQANQNRRYKNLVSKTVNSGDQNDKNG